MPLPDDLISLLDRCDEFWLASAAFTRAAWDALEPSVEGALDRGATGTIIIGLDLYCAEPSALRRMLRLAKKQDDSSLDFRVFQQRPRGIFHPKVALFREGNKFAAIVGSSNLTTAAWERNSELDVILTGPRLVQPIAAQFSAWLEDERCHPLDSAWIARATRYWKKFSSERRRIFLPTSAQAKGAASISFQARRMNAKMPTRIAGNLFVFTGRCAVSETRGDLRNIVLKYGGFFSDKPSACANAACLVAGRTKGRRKLDAAEAAGTPVMTPDQFWMLVAKEERIAGAGRK
jgi:hypothetical protein